MRAACGWIGIRRPAIPSDADWFGFDDAGVGFGQGGLRPIKQLEPRTPMGDIDYRRMVRARARTVLFDGTIETFTDAAQEIDENATVSDNMNMTITITTSSDVLMGYALNFGALPAPSGVAVSITTS